MIEFKYVQFRQMGEKQEWDCYSIKYDFFVGDIIYYEDAYVFCAADTDIAFSVNTLTDIVVFLAMLDLKAKSDSLRSL